MSSFSLEELAVIALLLDEDDNQKKRKRMWVHEAWKKRRIEGEFATLFKELLDDESKFYQYFRMSQNSFNILYNKLYKNLVKKDTHWRESIKPKERLAICLRYLATGDSMKTISFSYRMGHSTVFAIIMETCKTIVDKLLPEVMPKPNEDDWRRIAAEFRDIWHFPNCLGAMDGKHISIQAPPNSGSDYFNYKKTFSVVLLALVDAQYKFIAVDVGSYGKNSDGGIFSNSNLGKSLENGNLNVPPDEMLPGTSIPAPYVIVGDEAFPLKTYLLRPYPQNQLDDSKRTFNYRLSHARRISENTFGILVQKFRIFNRRIQLNPENLDNLIMATCVLHNFIRERDGILAQAYHMDPLTDREGSSIALNNLSQQGGNATQRAFFIRDLYKTYFNSAAGAVPWQYDKI